MKYINNFAVFVLVAVGISVFSTACTESSNPKWNKVSELTPQEKIILSMANDSMDKIKNNLDVLTEKEITSLLIVYPNLIGQLYQKGALNLLSGDSIATILYENPNLFGALDKYELLGRLSGENLIVLGGNNDKLDKLFKNNNLYIRIEGIDVASSLLNNSNSIKIVEKYYLWKFLQKEDWLRLLTRSFEYSKYCKIWVNFSDDDWINLLESDYRYKVFFKKVDAFSLYLDKEGILGYDGSLPKALSKSSAFINLLVEENHPLLNNIILNHPYLSARLVKNNKKYKEYFLKNQLYDKLTPSCRDSYIRENPDLIDHFKQIDNLDWQSVLRQNPKLISRFMKLKDWSKYRYDVIGSRELISSIPEIRRINEIVYASADKLVSDMNDPFVLEAIDKLKMWNKFSREWDNILLKYPNLIMKCKENNSWKNVKTKTKAILLSKDQKLIDEIDEETWSKFKADDWGILISSNLCFIEKFYKYGIKKIQTTAEWKDIIGYEPNKKIEEFWINKYNNRTDLTPLQRYFITKITAICYAEGIGVNKNEEKYYEIFSNALKTNPYPLLYTDIAACYLYGIGIKKDLNESLKYIEKSPKDNLKTKRLWTVYYFEKKDFHNFEKYAWELINAGDVETMFQLGRIYYIGRDLPTNRQQAIDLLQKSAELGNYNATRFLKMLSELEGDNQRLHRHLSRLLGNLRTGDLYLVQHLGLYGVSGINPSMSPYDVIRQIAKVLPRWDNNMKESLLAPLGFTPLQKTILESGYIELLAE